MILERKAQPRNANSKFSSSNTVTFRTPFTPTQRSLTFTSLRRNLEKHSHHQLYIYKLNGDCPSHNMTCCWHYVKYIQAEPTTNSKATTQAITGPEQERMKEYMHISKVCLAPRTFGTCSQLNNLLQGN